MMLPWHITITDQTMCLGHTNPPCLYDYYPDAPTALADLPRANQSSLAPEGGYHVMTYGAFQDGMRAFYLSDPLREVTPERWDFALTIMPPEALETCEGVTRFLMGEHLYGCYTYQYAQWQGRSFTRLVDADDRTTWITAAQCAALPPQATP